MSNTDRPIHLNGDKLYQELVMKPNTDSQDEPDSKFIVEFRKLKDLRNNRHMDEPEFDDKVEQLAADIYAHPTGDGYCCACEADIAFIEGDKQRLVTEASRTRAIEELSWVEEKLVNNPGLALQLISSRLATLTNQPNRRGE